MGGIIKVLTPPPCPFPASDEGTVKGKKMPSKWPLSAFFCAFMAQESCCMNPPIRAQYQYG